MSRERQEAGGLTTALPPFLSTPETAELLGEDLLQVRAWAAGGRAGPCKLSELGQGGDASWGPGLSHFPSCWPRDPQEEEREKWWVGVGG